MRRIIPITAVLLILLSSFSFKNATDSTKESKTAFAQEAITPGIYCVGGSAQPPCATIPPTNAITQGVNPTTGTMQGKPIPTFSPTVLPTGNTAAVQPCTTDSGNVQVLHEGRHKNQGGFLEAFFQFLLQLFELLFQQSGQLPPSGTFPTPQPSTIPSPSPAPCTSPTIAIVSPIVGPTIAATPTIFNQPTTAPSAIILGAAVEPDELDDASFTKALKQYKFTSLTPENAMKFGPLEPNQGQFNWADADKIVAFAQANNMRVRGHNLVWHVEVPNWVNGLSNTAAEAALKNHIQTVVGRYKGKIAQWDVVNEGLNDDGTLRDTVWKQKIGDTYIEKAFQWAHEADPNAKLFYNEYGSEGIADRGGNKKAKSDAVYNMVKDFKARGIPIDGVGLQTHSAGDYPGTGAEIGANIKRLVALGVQVEITELDVININDQAQRYAEIGTACKQNGCSAVTTWGLYDGHTWLSGQSPLLLDNNFQPKPGYTALINALGL